MKLWSKFNIDCMRFEFEVDYHEERNSVSVSIKVDEKVSLYFLLIKFKKHVYKLTSNFLKTILLTNGNGYCYFGG